MRCSFGRSTGSLRSGTHPARTTPTAHLYVPPSSPMLTDPPPDNCGIPRSWAIRRLRRSTGGLARPFLGLRRASASPRPAGSPRRPPMRFGRQARASDGGFPSGSGIFPAPESSVRSTPLLEGLAPGTRTGGRNSPPAPDPRQNRVLPVRSSCRYPGHPRAPAGRDGTLAIIDLPPRSHWRSAYGVAVTPGLARGGLPHQAGGPTLRRGSSDQESGAIGSGNGHPLVWSLELP